MCHTILVPHFPLFLPLFPLLFSPRSSPSLFFSIHLILRCYYPIFLLLFLSFPSIYFFNILISSSFFFIFISFSSFVSSPFSSFLHFNFSRHSFSFPLLSFDAYSFSIFHFQYHRRLPSFHAHVPRTHHDTSFDICKVTPRSLFSVSTPLPVASSSSPVVWITPDVRFFHSSFFSLARIRAARERYVKRHASFPPPPPSPLLSSSSPCPSLARSSSEILYGLRHVRATTFYGPRTSSGETPLWRNGGKLVFVVP